MNMDEYKDFDKQSRRQIRSKRCEKVNDTRR